ncbi:MAG: hypothetical protein MSD82_04825 [Prevotella sp.]|nr:hypothetical protein [Prevotella sp.]
MKDPEAALRIPICTARTERNLSTNRSDKCHEPQTMPIPQPLMNKMMIA